MIIPYANNTITYIIVQVINILIILALPEKFFLNLNQLFLESTFFRSNFIILLVLLLLFFDSSSASKLAVLKYSTHPFIFLGLIALGFVYIFFTTVYDFSRKKRKIEEDSKNQLLTYVKEVEQLYDEVASFRHDYINILFSLKMAITSKDIDQVEKIFNDTVAPTEKIINTRSYEITKLNRISPVELKSLLYIKINLARSKNIDVILDIPAIIKSIFLDNLVLMRLVSILLDNAIENAEISSMKEITISIFENNTTQYINISNSVEYSESNIEKIFEKNYSTKEQVTNKEHGLGLFYLKKVIDSSENLFLETKIIGHMFYQSLQINKVLTQKKQ